VHVVIVPTRRRHIDHCHVGTTGCPVRSS
jgi:hypothetical protein